MKRLVFILLGLASIVAAYFFGYASGTSATTGQEEKIDVVELQKSEPDRMVSARGGWWTRRRASSRSPEDDSRGARLRSLAYVAGTHPARSATRIVRHEQSLAYQGLNLYSSAHAPEAVLMDMNGTVLHRWRKDRDLVWPDLTGEDPSLPARYFRRIHLLEDGGLLAVYEYTGLIRLDRDSNLVWASRLEQHHDLDRDSEGRIWVLARAHASRPDFEDHPFWDDEILLLEPTGELVDRLSLYDLIADSDYAPLLDIARGVPGPPPADLFHANTLEIVRRDRPRLGPAFRKGNLLISIRTLNTIAVIDPGKQKVLWSMTGRWRMQHQPTLLDNDRILLFDNLGGLTSSRVLEIDPGSQSIEWEYRGSEDEPFFSALQGSNQRLPNGNTLITESDYGRAFEVTPEGQIVWEFQSPHTTGANDELVAILPEMIRLPFSAVPWVSHDQQP